MVAPPHRYLARLAAAELAPAFGRVRRLGAATIDASGPAARLGQLCRVNGALAEVVAVDEAGIRLIRLDEGADIALGDRVEWADEVPRGGGEWFAGRAVDALGRPIDDAGPLATDPGQLPRSAQCRALDRVPSARPLATGLRAIDGLLPLAVGQRVGVFAASGVGKSTLVDQLARGIACDRLILCLVGERGREVSAAWAARARYAASRSVTLVAATSDESPAMRVRAVEQAVAIAQHWRDAGEHVLLVLDSITRYAMALREVGLAAGEPATVRAYTPSVFAALPRVVEQCGARRSGGAITAVMTVLSETDDVDDPIVEVMKSLLDGHLVLSRALAETGHFPAIDVPRSVSRGGHGLMGERHAGFARQAIAALSALAENRILIDSGVYRPGTNVALDRALARREALNRFLRQGIGELIAADATVAGLAQLFAEWAPDE